MKDFRSEKALVRAFYDSLDAVDADLNSVMETFIAEVYLWRGFHPFNELTSGGNVATQFWQPLRASLKHLQRRQDIFMAGENTLERGGTWVVSMGHLMGLFDEPWLGIRPTGKMAFLRYCEFNCVKDGKISETAMFFDIPHLMIQAGQNPFPPQTGAHTIQPGPICHTGLMFEPQDPAEGTRTLAAVDYMVNDIKTWKGGREEPLVDELRRSWTEDMYWSGPAGIGATYTIERYTQQHSGPFRASFKDRIFNGHICRMAEGRFGGFFGWPNLTLEPTGGFMGMPATKKPADMRVIDIYSRRDDRLFENWIFIDLLHFWKQQGLDVLGRLPTAPD